MLVHVFRHYNFAIILIFAVLGYDFVALTFGCKLASFTLNL